VICALPTDKPQMRELRSVSFHILNYFSFAEDRQNDTMGRCSVRNTHDCLRTSSSIFLLTWVCTGDVGNRRLHVFNDKSRSGLAGLQPYLILPRGHADPEIVSIAPNVWDAVGEIEQEELLGRTPWASQNRR
jgi:hypothetical protein